MKPVVTIVPHNRAATVANARLQGLHIDRSALDRRARHAEGQIPVGSRDDPFGELARDEGIDLLVYTVVMAAAFVTGYSVGGLISEWLIR